MNNSFQNSTTTNFSILIIEEATVFALELDLLLQKTGYSTVNRVDNFAAALTSMNHQTPDLICLNPTTKGNLTELAIAQQIKTLNIPLLLLTSFTDKKRERTTKGFNIVGYLTQPVSTYTISTAIDEVIRHQCIKGCLKPITAKMFLNKRYLFFKKKGLYEKIALAAICYIQANRDYITIVTKDNNKYVVHLALITLEKALVPQGFIRVHRSYLANLKNATSVDVEHHTISFGGVRIPFSRRRKGVVLGRVLVV